MYHLVALSVVLWFVARDEMRRLAPEPQLARPAFGARPRPAFAAGFTRPPT
jgi:hypothetical protein